ncbi:MAG: prepilin-type N-terminal cleavage/methylation domain-containing protein [Lentisphaeria bacterium]|nr:prepilin-type N-terminal cleavage/methylation domain-containing protein [Lentisphaeria bacterium]
MKKHFTLIELLVVIAIIAILAAILLPALGKARDKAKTSGCISNLKTLNTAVLLYSEENQDYMPFMASTTYKPAGFTSSLAFATWKAQIAPYTGKDGSGYGWNYWGKFATGVFACPEWSVEDMQQADARNKLGPGSTVNWAAHGGGYGYPYVNARNEPKHLGYENSKIFSKSIQQSNPSETVIIGESCDFTSVGYTAAILYGNTVGKVNGRHNGYRDMPIAWGDGHVSVMTNSALLAGKPRMAPEAAGTTYNSTYYYAIRK